MEQLRIKNCYSLEDIEYGFIETNGELSLVTKGQSFSSIIISDGNLYEKNLKFSGLDYDAFEKRFLKSGLTSISDVFLALCDQNKRIYVYMKDTEGGPYAKEIEI